MSLDLTLFQHPRLSWLPLLRSSADALVTNNLGGEVVTRERCVLPRFPVATHVLMRALRPLDGRWAACDWWMWGTQPDKAQPFNNLFAPSLATSLSKVSIVPRELHSMYLRIFTRVIPILSSFTLHLCLACKTRRNAAGVVEQGSNRMLGGGTLALPSTSTAQPPHLQRESSYVLAVPIPVPGCTHTHVSFNAINNIVTNW